MRNTFTSFCKHQDPSRKLCSDLKIVRRCRQSRAASVLNQTTTEFLKIYDQSADLPKLPPSRTNNLFTPFSS